MKTAFVFCLLVAVAAAASSGPVTVMTKTSLGDAAHGTTILKTAPSGASCSTGESCASSSSSAGGVAAVHSNMHSVTVEPKYKPAPEPSKEPEFVKPELKSTPPKFSGESVEPEHKDTTSTQAPEVVEKLHHSESGAASEDSFRKPELKPEPKCECAEAAKDACPCMHLGEGQQSVEVESESAGTAELPSNVAVVSGSKA